MKRIAFPLVMLTIVTCEAQLPNKQYNQHNRAVHESAEKDIVASENQVSIITKVLYNAVPDGYHVTFTKSFIGKSVEDVELQMNTIIEKLIKDVQSMNISKKDVSVDIVSMDPIFNINLQEPAETNPLGYKVTQNITFNVRNISFIGPLSKKCLDYGIFDLINTEAYIFDSKVIYDSLYNKAVEILEMKKKTCTRIGWVFAGGVTTFNKTKDVLYPSERYLNAYAINSSLYQHHISQNTSVAMQRSLDVDNYFNLNLKDADYVFHSDKTVPVIQFYYELNYAYTKEDTKARSNKEKEDKTEKIFYILDKTGNLKKIEM
ncbi:MAG: SIMPL domain-containing protein [Bacteroidia bacterium]|jgi:uncharacterized protein YggE